MSTHKTAKGTELPISVIKGKEYLEVKYRLVWFREERPEWGIETEVIKLTENFCLSKATIKDEKGRVISMGMKSETPQGFPDYIEKSETGAIGRALALCGYGTQFCADELDEGSRVVDSPVSPKASTKESERGPGEYRVDFGKHKNKLIKDIDIYELQKDVSYWGNRSEQEDLSLPAKAFIKYGSAFLDSRDVTNGRAGAK